MLAPRMIEPVLAIWDSLAGRVSTEAPAVLVRASLRSSAGRRRLDEKEREKTHTLHGPLRRQAVAKKHGSARRASFISAGACGAVKKREEAPFRSRRGRGAAKEKAAGGCSLPAPAPTKKITKSVLCHRHNNTHRGASTPSHRRRHPAATAVSRDCAASRGAPVPIGRDDRDRNRNCNRGYGRGRGRRRPARDVTSRRVACDRNRNCNRGHGRGRGRRRSARDVTSRRVACACAQMT